MSSAALESAEIRAEVALVPVLPRRRQSRIDAVVRPLEEDETMRSVRDQIASRCVHFTGVLNERCRADVSYRELRARSEGGKGLPCFSPNAPPCCELRRLPSEKEIAAEIEASDAALRRYHDAIEAGRCPECGHAFEPLRQDGCCVYAACGHRLGQGRVAQFRHRGRASA